MNQNYFFWIYKAQVPNFNDVFSLLWKYIKKKYLRAKIYEDHWDLRKLLTSLNDLQIRKVGVTSGLDSQPC